MKFGRRILAVVFAASLVGTISLPSLATETADAPAGTHHEYSAYEKLILMNVSQFHASFDAHEFIKNGELVAENIHVNSNGVAIEGRAAFVDRIARFVGPFPDVNIQDVVTIVDGNRASVRYILTGTQDGDLQTPEGLVHATHKHIKVDGAEFFTFDKYGKVVDLVTIERLDQLFEQLRAP
jgi:predicted SnoaL-like aldol condensation-catalyzing enzyme